MSIITVTKDEATGKIDAQLMRLNVDKKGNPIDNVSTYAPTDDEKKARQLILKHFAMGYVTQQKPRVEFNDLSLMLRDQVDQMAWNTYQPNNGEAMEGDTSSWRSNAIRPVVRNKAISIAAHATARLVFPKIFAYNDQSDEQNDAAQVMSDLIEWAAHQSGYDYYSLNRVIAALYSPASIGYTEYAEVTRMVKTEKDENGNWILEPMLDEDLSGFRDEVVPVDELFIENFFEPDIQKQGWLIRRKVISFSLAQAKYGHYDNFKFVSPGVQVLYNDANQTFYQVYDTNMRQEDVEEVTYWNKSLDVKLCLVNGVLLSEFDNPNPRIDKKYPFDKFGYELINSRCFYYKSLAFKLMHDANIVNTLYPMIIDGTYLNVMPAMVAIGGQTIGSDVVVPGAVTTLDDPNADLRAIKTDNNLKAGLDVMRTVEDSISESSQSEIQQGQAQGGSQTAFEISRLETNAATVLGLFVKMISEHVRQFGKLRLMDIIQYLTIPEVSDIEDNDALVYRTFLMPDKQANGQSKTRKIKFDDGLPSGKISPEEYLNLSYGVLSEQGGINSKQEIYRVNPELFRKLKYMVTVSPDVMNPMSEELERAYMLEEYDRAIMNPLLDQEQVTRDFLLSAYPKSRKDVGKYMKKNNNPVSQIDPNAPPMQSQPAQGRPGQSPSPSAQIMSSMPGQQAAVPR